MRIGLCTTDFPSAMPAKALFERIKNYGFDCVQLAFCSVTECEFTASNQIEIPEGVSERALDAIREASEWTGLPIGAVNGTWNMAHPDAAVRREGLRRFDGFLRAVHALDCPIATLCSGTRSPEHLWKYHPENTSDSAWRDMSDSMKAVCALAEKHEVTLAIETEAANIISSPESARRIMDEVGSNRLKMILDAANLFPAGTARRENVRPTLDRAFAHFGRDIVLAHGKDIRESEGIDFCGTGFGIVDFPYMIEGLRKVGFEGDMMLHGIYEERDIPGCLDFMRRRIG